MKVALPDLVPQYASAFKAYLDSGAEEGLRRAYELGRQAFSDGLGVLEMAVLLHRAVLTVRPRRRSTPEQLATATEDFFLECLSPFEMAHRGVQEANAALRRVNEMLEDVAKRIAHALHDEAGQLLASVYLAVDGLSHDLPPAQRGRLDDIKVLRDSVAEQLRRLSHELRPTILDDLGLVPALEFLAEGVAKRTGLSISVDGSMTKRPAPSTETVIYRIVQEAFNNVVRHARASRVDVQLRDKAGQLHCSIKDDGVGFEAPTGLAGHGSQGLGLSGIRERLDTLGAVLEIDSAPGQGTELRFTIPIGGTPWLSASS
jgi:two-component system sensor histidine kinase UhpB